jgi:aspartate kinase
LIVMKFGGTSVADAERIGNVAGIVEQRRSLRPLVVVSALAEVTDLLEAAVTAARESDLEAQETALADIERRHRWALSGCIRDSGRRHDLSLEIDARFDELRQLLRSIRILGDRSPRSSDAILSFGEILSSRIMAAVMEGEGLDACWFDPRGLVATDGSFGEAVPDLERMSEICSGELTAALEGDRIPVTGGFVGRSAEGVVTTLGRGGSDTTAAVLGAVLGAEEIQIWTDVDGLMSADPKIVPDAGTLESVSFAEAAELAFHGARVLHPAAIAPAVRRKIPVRILNSLEPDRPGTVILEQCAPGAKPIASVASRTGMGIVRLAAGDMRAASSILGPVLEILRREGADPELLMTSEVTVTAVVPGDAPLGRLKRSLEADLGADVSTEPGMAVVCVVGGGIAPGNPKRGEAMAAMAAIGAGIVATTGSSACIAAVIAEADLEAAVRRLHARFFEGGESE